MTKKEKDTLIKKYHKKNDSQLKEIALDLVNKLDDVNLSDNDMLNYQEKAEALKSVLDQKNSGRTNYY